MNGDGGGGTGVVEHEHRAMQDVGWGWMEKSVEGCCLQRAQCRQAVVRLERPRQGLGTGIANPVVGEIESLRRVGANRDVEYHLIESRFQIFQLDMQWFLIFWKH